MMAGHSLVVAGAHFAPQRERGLPLRRVPRAARPGEVLARARVVHRGRAARWRDHGLAPAQWRRDVEVGAVELGDGPVDELLIPTLERVDTFDGARRVMVEVIGDRRDALSGQYPLGYCAHALLDAVQLFPTPRVGLVEIELDAAVDAGEQRVAVAADGITRIGPGRVLVAQEGGQLGVF